MSETCLRQILIDFLRGDEVKYPEITADILRRDPFHISDDHSFYFDSINLLEATQNSLDFPSKQRLRITFKENGWNFVFKKVPGTHDYYFDIDCKDFEIEEEEAKLPGNSYKKISSDDEVKYLAEIKRRKLIATFIKKETITQTQKLELLEEKENANQDSSSKKKGKKGKKGQKSAENTEKKVEAPMPKGPQTKTLYGDLATIKDLIDVDAEREELFEDYEMYENILMEIQNNQASALNNMLTSNALTEKLLDPQQGKRMFEIYGPNGEECKQEHIEKMADSGEELSDGQKKVFTDFGIGTNYANSEFFNGFSHANLK